MLRFILSLTFALAAPLARAALVHNGYGNGAFAYDNGSLLFLFSDSGGVPAYGQRYAQKFTPAASPAPWLLDAVMLPIGSSPLNLKLSIVEDAGDSPGATEIWSVTNPPQITDSLDNQTLPATGLLDPAISYWLVVETAVPGQNASAYWAGTDPALAGTQASGSHDGGDWSAWSVYGTTAQAAFAVFGHPLATPTTNGIATAVEVYFPTVSGNWYQVQAATDPAATNWLAVGGPIWGDGGVRAYLDSTRGHTQRTYRVVTE